MLGDFELSVFSDGTYPLDGGAFFGVVPKVMWSRKIGGGREELRHRRTEFAVHPHRQADRAGRDRNGQQALGAHGEVLRTAGEAARKSRGGRRRSRRYRHRHQLASAFRSLRMEYRARREWQVRRDVSARKILRARRRVAVCAASQRTRLDQLHLGELRSAGRERADDAAEGRRRNCPGHFGEDLSRPHGAHAGDCDSESRRKSPLLPKSGEKWGTRRPLVISPT